MKKNNLSSIIHHPSSKRGFTLMEILIVVALIAIIAAVAIVLFNPWAQIGKGYDAKRKRELADLQKVLEDYYNDKGCYPKPQEVCYDNLKNVCKGFYGSGSYKFQSQACHICGNEPAPPSFSSFSPYMSRLPCDPQHSTHQYLYEVESANGTTCNQTSADITSPCPQWYRIYSDFSNLEDQASKSVGCTGGACGLSPGTSDSPFPYGYDYGLSSPNKGLNISIDFWGLNRNIPPQCNSCGGGYEQCIINGYHQIFPNKYSCEHR